MEGGDAAGDALGGSSYIVETRLSGCEAQRSSDVIQKLRSSPVPNAVKIVLCCFNIGAGIAKLVMLVGKQYVLAFAVRSVSHDAALDPIQKMLRFYLDRIGLVVALQLSRESFLLLTRGYIAQNAFLKGLEPCFRSKRFYVPESVADARGWEAFVEACLAWVTETYLQQQEEVVWRDDEKRKIIAALYQTGRLDKVLPLLVHAAVDEAFAKTILVRLVGHTVKTLSEEYVARNPRMCPIFACGGRKYVLSDGLPKPKRSWGKQKDCIQPLMGNNTAEVRQLIGAATDLSKLEKSLDDVLSVQILLCCSYLFFGATWYTVRELYAAIAGAPPATFVSDFDAIWLVLATLIGVVPTALFATRPKMVKYENSCRSWWHYFCHPGQFQERSEAKPDTVQQHRSPCLRKMLGIAFGFGSAVLLAVYFILYLTQNTASVDTTFGRIFRCSNVVVQGITVVTNLLVTVQLTVSMIQRRAPPGLQRGYFMFLREYSGRLYKRQLRIIWHPLPEGICARARLVLAKIVTTSIALGVPVSVLAAGVTNVMSGAMVGDAIELLLTAASRNGSAVNASQNVLIDDTGLPVVSAYSETGRSEVTGWTLQRGVLCLFMLYYGVIRMGRPNCRVVAWMQQTVATKLGGLRHSDFISVRFLAEPRITPDSHAELFQVLGGYD